MSSIRCSLSVCWRVNATCVKSRPSGASSGSGSLEFRRQWWSLPKQVRSALCSERRSAKARWMLRREVFVGAIEARRSRLVRPRGSCERVGGFAGGTADEHAAATAADQQRLVATHRGSKPVTPRPCFRSAPELRHDAEQPRPPPASRDWRVTSGTPPHQRAS